MQPQARERQEPPEAGRGKKEPPQSLPRERGPASTMTLDFWPLELLENTLLLF